MVSVPFEIPRSELDAKNSTAIEDGNGGHMSDAFDPWNSLATRFNDYDGFTPINMLIAHREVNGKLVPLAPYRCVCPEFTAFTKVCHDLKPTDMDRRNIMRDGPWIKEWWKKMKKVLSDTFNDFNRSGQHSGRSDMDYDWFSPQEQVCNLSSTISDS